MDPNANLQEQERIIERGATRGSTYYYADQARLGDLRRALSAWLDRGCFAPNWSLAPQAAKYFPR